MLGSLIFMRSLVHRFDIFFLQNVMLFCSVNMDMKMKFIISQHVAYIFYFR